MTTSSPSSYPYAFLFSLAFGALIPLVSTASNARPANAIELFDQAVARGLPQTIVLPVPAENARDHPDLGEGLLLIESPLDVTIRFPGEVSDKAEGTLYVATWQGKPAAATRTGNHLDISVRHPDTIEVIGFSKGTEGSHRVEAGLSHGEIRARTMIMPRYTAAERVATRPRHLRERPTIVFWLFLHDDTLGMTRQHIHASYLAWWLADMKRVLPTHRLWAIYSQQIAGVTDLPYGHGESLVDWTNAIDAYAKRESLPKIRGELEYKFMLVTNDEVAPGISGLAWLGGDQAIASLKGRFTIIAHEYGHTLNANHDVAEVSWSSGWPCETNLTSDTSSLRANCYRYSATNERRMRAYAANEWTVPVRPDPPDIPLRAVE
ncbi:hypothetical protein BJI69_08840 [Luteibacter rhizovicinus DSM 16549]|uniref:Peptidase M12B domain-containing protein n=1 Tax=Luteibacter rhizovicinus DSM 16549 TaxID=1440763 RepID=A0A1L3ESG9_9GAMM|nr:hypothetical protein [Luteibacter rhizovicinus]APG03990.1 hypothetical protein BJI69_08840 [Luteibacter rhizovicinus DSM 16549]